MLDGAHCPVCRLQGPNLRVEGPDLERIPQGGRVHIDFSCGGCDRRWRWTVEMTEGKPVYKLVGRVPRKGRVR